MSDLSKPTIAVIVAMAQNRVIGKDNQLPWHLPNDLKYFKATTLGKPIIMGRKTYESIGRPLPGRTNIVVTSDRKYHREGVHTAHNIADAVELGRQIAQTDGVTEVMVIGGARLYQQVLNDVSRLYLTRVNAEVSGDAHFPELDWSQCSQLSREDFDADNTNSYSYSFEVFERS